VSPPERREQPSDECRWFCAGCFQFTDQAPCELCAAGHDEILVVLPGQEPPCTGADIDGWATVDDFDWPAEAYA
jgi:hypothetical protein